MTFKTDLQLGNEYEKQFKNELNENAVISQGKFKPYDLITETTKYEIKADRWTMKTGNIAIEYECFGKPSGITTTESDFYIYNVLNKDIIKDGIPIVLRKYKIPTIIIKEYIKDKKFHKHICGGDGNLSKMYLFKEKFFKDFLS